MIDDSILTVKEISFRLCLFGLVTLFLVLLITSVFTMTLNSKRLEREVPAALGIKDEVILPTRVNELFCGGKRGVSCPEGYGCELDGNYPDASGVCLKR